MAATELAARLCEAIERRWLVMFEYGDLIRVVEPHRVGVNSAGHQMLSGWMRGGYSRSDPDGGWRSFLLSDVRALQLLSAPFLGPRPGYTAHDPRMREVFCQLAAVQPAHVAPAARLYAPNAERDRSQVPNETRPVVSDEPAHRSG